MKIGFVGIGQIGAPMCRNLIKRKQDVIIFTRRPAAGADMISLGAEAAGSVKELAASCDVVFTCLPGPPEIEEVVLGPHGIAAGANPGLTYIDLSTNSPSLARGLASELANKGVFMLDAPVSGGVTRAEAGEISIIVGGERAVFDKMEPLLRCMGKNIYYTGPVGSGCTIKLINNLLTFCNLTAANEGFMLAAQAGVELEILLEVVNNSSGASDIVKRKMRTKVLRGDFTPQGSLNTTYKDLNLALRLGEEMGSPLFLGSLVGNMMRQAIAKGYGNQDVSALIRPLEDVMGKEVRSKGSI